MSRGRGNPRYQRGGKRPDRDAGRKEYEAPRISTKRDERAEQQEVEQVDLFYIDGKAYSVDADLPPAIGLRYLRTLHDGGNMDIAYAQLLIEAMGRDTYDALAECDDVGRKEMATIVDKVMELALAGRESGKSSDEQPS